MKIFSITIALSALFGLQTSYAMYAIPSGPNQQIIRIKNNDYEFAKELLSKNPGLVHETRECGITKIMDVIQYGNFYILLLLLNYKSNVNAVDQNNCSALFFLPDREG